MKQTHESRMSLSLGAMSLIVVAIMLAGSVAVVNLLNRNGSAVPEHYPAEVQLTDSDDGAMVNLGRGGSLIIALPSNRSTGFRWYVGERAGPGLELAGDPAYVPAGSTNPVPGGPGTEVFTFKAERPGTVQLVLEYRRSFEPNVPAAKVFRVAVQIQ